MAERKEKTLTRKDVLRLIKENGGTAEGLDLSEKVFEDGVDLSGLDLKGIILNNARFPTHFEGDQLVGAKFDGSNLTRADLRSINFQYAQFKKLNKQPTCLAIADLRGSSLLNANFQGADLTGAKFGDVAEAEGYQAAMPDDTDFRGANLFRANFKGCYFYGTKLEGAFIRGVDIFDAHLEEADWGSYVIGEENKKDFYSAVHYYRRLKTWYTNSGISDIAAKFYYREKEANRKALKWHSKSSFRHRLALELSYLGFGHGEGWKRLLFGWIVGVIFVLAAAYYFWGSFSSSSFWDTLYYSATSFSALGYGKWAPQPTGWAKGMGAAEAIIGVFMMALLLVTFVRKWTR